MDRHGVVTQVTVRMDDNSNDKTLDVYKKDDGTVEIILSDGDFSVAGNVNFEVLKKHLALLED